MSWLAAGAPAAVIPEEEGDYCSECGQLFVGRAVAPAGKESAHPWWAWSLIALGAALMITFGLSAWQAAHERAAMQDLLPQSARENRLEGLSVQLAALRAGAPPGTVDRYLFAKQQLDRALVEMKFALAMVLLGFSFVARRFAQRGADRRLSSSDAITRPALLEPVLRSLLKGWALVETVALAGFRLLTVAFLYLLSERMVEGQPPTWDVLQETLDRVIQVVAKLPDLVR